MLVTKIKKDQSAIILIQVILVKIKFEIYFLVPQDLLVLAIQYVYYNNVTLYYSW